MLHVSTEHDGWELEPLSFAFGFAQWPCKVLQPNPAVQKRLFNIGFILVKLIQFKKSQCKVRQFDRFCFFQNRTFCYFYFYFLPSGLKWHFLFEGAGRALPQRQLEETQRVGGGGSVHHWQLRLCFIWICKDQQIIGFNIHIFQTLLRCSLTLSWWISAVLIQTTEVYLQRLWAPGDCRGTMWHVLSINYVMWLMIIWMDVDGNLWRGGNLVFL